MAEGNAVSKALAVGLDKALALQHGQVVNHVDKMRRSRPDATPAEIIAALEKHFLAAVSALGAAAGGPAAAPRVGTAVTFALAGGEIVGVLEVTALFALAVAEVHGVPIKDLERRRTLVMAVVLGQSAAGVVEKTAGRLGGHWGKNLVGNETGSSCLGTRSPVRPWRRDWRRRELPHRPEQRRGCAQSLRAAARLVAARGTTHRPRTSRYDLTTSERSSPVNRRTRAGHNSSVDGCSTLQWMQVPDRQPGLWVQLARTVV